MVLGQCLSQRDLLGTTFTAGSRIATKLSRTVTSYIAGGMTPVLQVTDTDYAHRAETGAEKNKQKMISEMKLEAVARGEVFGSEDMKLNCERLMKVINADHNTMKVSSETDKGGLTHDGVVAAC